MSAISCDHFRNPANTDLLIPRAYPVTDTEELDVDTIVAENPTGLYTHFQPVIRQRIDDLASHPLYSDDGNSEILIYNEAGERVSRVRCTIDRSAPRCGITLNLLGAVRDLANDPHGDADDLEDDTRAHPRVPPNAFPQAFLRNSGFVYSNHALPAFSPLLKLINSNVAIQEDIEIDNGNVHTNTARAVKNIKYQAYSEAVHRMSPRHSDHTVAHGMVTAAAAGLLATTTTDRLSAQSHRRDIRLMPFEILARKLAAPCSPSEPSPSDLRLEAVHCIDMWLIRPENRNGRCVMS